ncbi:oxygen-independent coproporphyrinogen III oxidase [Endozoicomonas sp. SCSIO W0465]|uniref:oxygen-independent coproporphyrinogen III oxidase n=1 Tax=Endozoicomonas sp. SCSIO W0465 TaxID=2918516 RepID=UPI002075BE7A|nr:oxygen-independent coproporphyrinogen III oxidase [Endozoicomonas sp. SCSIO W0465]USE34954.1 oxygen-independent coproporphyrinogen III oxidase [Endozoicomonas sp. SCSIO W0465]
MMNSAPVWDKDLIHRYNHSGPRYTSYPTAVQFDGSFDIHKYHENAQSSASSIKPLSLYFHIPFCSHVCYYCACNKIVTKHRERANIYLEYLFREIEMQSALYSNEQRVEQLHFGGGTPTFLSRDQMTDLMGHISQHFQLTHSDGADYSIELDPREVDWPMMGTLRDLGFNRISIGVQDLNPRVQEAVNRVQPESMIQSVLDASRVMAFRSVHMDLIYGLPFQSASSFMETIDRVVDMAPDRLSLFNYAHLPHRFKPQRRINEQDLPVPEMKLEILHKATEKLLDQGYIYIGMDHFALPDDELAVAREEGTLHRNFQGYTTHGHCDLIGMGVSAISQVGDTYIQNSTDEAQYYAMINEQQLPMVRGLKMTDDDKVRQTVITQLICHFKLNFSDIEAQFGIQFRDYFRDELARLEPMREDGLVSYNSDGLLEVLPKGTLLIRNICMQFDHYLHQPEMKEKPLYSKVI